MKKIFVIALTAVLSVMSANAQDCSQKKCCNGEFPGYWYVQLQAGVHRTTFSGDYSKLLSPAFSIGLGRQITPVIGARLNIEGLNAKNLNNEGHFKYATGSFDVTANLVNLFTKKCCNVVNFSPLIGVGSCWSDANTISPSKFSANFRLGAILGFNVSRNIDLSLEYRANTTSNYYDGSKINESYDWYQALYLGITFKFGKKAVKPAPVAEPVYATRVDTTWYDDTEYKTEEAAEQIQRDIHYSICQSDPVDPAKVSEIANFVKTHKDAKVTVTGYADKGTGNAKVNMKYSQQRAEAVANALKDAGVPADIMTVDWKGDTVQPFAENDANRVAITVASGICEKKTPVVTKKFRTEEVRYQVQ